MQPTRNRIILLSSCCLFVVLAGCPLSKFPLSDPNNNEIDQSLIGTWVSSETGANGYASKSTMVISIENGLPKGVLQLKERTQTTGRTTPGGKLPDTDTTSIHYLIPTVVNEFRYYSEPFFQDSWKPEMGWKPELIKCYAILKYEVKDNKWIAYGPSTQSETRLGASIKNGDLRGSSDDVFVTEPTDGLRKYVKDNESWFSLKSTRLESNRVDQASG